MTYHDTYLMILTCCNSDIVDAEPYSTGNVLTMLLASVNKWFDHSDERPDSFILSAESRLDHHDEIDQTQTSYSQRPHHTTSPRHSHQGTSPVSPISPTHRVKEYYSPSPGQTNPRSALRNSYVSSRNSTQHTSDRRQ
jgi:hypothetical protein